MGDTGLEPVTSSVSCWRASQLRQSPDLLCDYSSPVAVDKPKCAGRRAAAGLWRLVAVELAAGVDIYEFFGGSWDFMGVVSTILVVGGDWPGLLCALNLKLKLPELRVTVLRQ